MESSNGIVEDYMKDASETRSDGEVELERALKVVKDGLF